MLYVNYYEIINCNYQLYLDATFITMTLKNLSSISKTITKLLQCVVYNVQACVVV